MKAAVKTGQNAARPREVNSALTLISLVMPSELHVAREIGRSAAPRGLLHLEPCGRAKLAEPTMMLGSSHWCRIAGATATVAVLAIGILAGKGAAEEFKAGGISLDQPWSRATPGGATVGAGYLTIKNDAETPDRLVSVSTEIAGSAEIHRMEMAHGIMKMRPLPEGVEVPAHGSVALAPGSYHVMFFDLKRPLKEGDSFPATLTFEKAGPLGVTFKVMGIGAQHP
jgi:copper(I)-binding protein